METQFNRDKKLQIMKTYLEKAVSFDNHEVECAVDKNIVEKWIAKLFEDANHFFENEKHYSDLDTKIQSMSDTIKEKDRIITHLERDNYELKKIIYSFKDDDD